MPAPLPLPLLGAVLGLEPVTATVVVTASAALATAVPVRAALDLAAAGFENVTVEKVAGVGLALDLAAVATVLGVPARSPQWR